MKRLRKVIFCCHLPVGTIAGVVISGVDHLAFESISARRNRFDNRNVARAI